jgi:hypothetical protein
MLIYDGFGVPTVIGSTLFIFSLFFFLQSSGLFICTPYVERLCEGFVTCLKDKTIFPFTVA